MTEPVPPLASKPILVSHQDPRAFPAPSSGNPSSGPQDWVDMSLETFSHFRRQLNGLNDGWNKQS